MSAKHVENILFSPFHSYKVTKLIYFVTYIHTLQVYITL